MNGAVSSDRFGSLRWGAIASARAAEMPAFTAVGIIRLLNGGAVKIHAVARTIARKNAVMTTGSNWMFTSASGLVSRRKQQRLRLQQLRDHVEQVVGEADDLAEHPVPCDHED